MSMPSFEETNNPGYDDVFKKEKPSSKFSVFKLLSTLLSDQDERKKATVLTKELYKKESIVHLFEMINNGYKLTKDQKLKLDEHFYLLLDYTVPSQSRMKRVGLEKLGQILEKNIKIPDEYLAFILIHKSVFISQHIKGQETESAYPEITNLFRERLNTKEFRRVLFLEWKTIFEDMINNKTLYQNKWRTSDFYQSPHDYFKSKVRDFIHIFGKELFSEVNLEEYMKVLNDFKNYPKIHRNIDNEDKAWVRQNSVYLEAVNFPKYLDREMFFKLDKDFVPDTNVELEKVHINNLKKEMPENIKIMLENIESKYKELKNNQSYLSKDDWFNLHNIYNKRLKNTLKNYQEVDVSKTEKVIEQNGQTAEDLLKNSLQTVNEIMDVWLENIEQEKIKKMSVTASYIKNVKRMK